MSFGGTPSAGFTVDNDFQITAVVDGGSTGDVEVMSPGGTGSLSGFTFIEPPIISDCSPISAGNGTSVIITGTNFLGATSVSFGGTQALSFVINSSTEISAVVGAGANGNVTIGTPGGTANLPGFIFIPPPTITSFEPASGGLGTSVTIRGTNFNSVLSVLFGGFPAARFTVDSPSQIIAVVGTGNTGAVTVVTTGGTATMYAFSYVQPPSITSFSPALAGTGSEVRIIGTNLNGAAAVSFGETIAQSFTVSTDGTLIVAIIASGSSGIVSVTTQGGSASAPGFTFVLPPAITSFSPTSAGSSNLIIITGANFTGTTYVTFGGTPAAGFTVDSDSQISAVLNGVSSGAVSVTTPGGIIAMSGFKYIPPPTVTSFSPASSGRGMTITITGTNFNNVTGVSFGGTAAFSYTVNSSTKIVATVGAGSNGSVLVSALGGTGVKTGFNFIQTPRITSIFPVSGGAGTSISINGTYLSGATSVTFGGTAATSFIVMSDSSITAIVGAGSSGPVMVTTPGGSDIFYTFSFAQQPIITSFIPFSAGIGYSIDIIGTYLESVTAVSFGRTPAAEFFVNPGGTEIIAIVGSGSSGNISVTTPGGTAIIAGFTFVSQPTIIEFSPVGAASGAQVIITGTNLTGTTSVGFGGVPALNFSVDSDTQITAIVDGGATGQIIVTTIGGTAAKNGFTFLSSLSLTSFTPNAAGINSTVIIFGSGFLNATGVSFGLIPALSFIIVSDSQITAVVGTGSAGAVSVTTINREVSLDGFVYVSQITQVKDITADANLGSQLTFIAPVSISGWNLVVSANNNVQRTLNVFANTNWQVTVQDSNQQTTGYLTKYDGNNYYGVKLNKPLYVSSDNGNGIGLTVNSNSGGILATGTPAGQNVTNGGDLRSLIFTQAVGYTDTVLNGIYSYHIVLTFTVCNSSY